MVLACLIPTSSERTINDPRDIPAPQALSKSLQPVERSDWPYNQDLVPGRIVFLVSPRSDEPGVNFLNELIKIDDSTESWKKPWVFVNNSRSYAITII